ncbi:uncharacterized protein ATC70_005936 [Mucor velutinosus]|uniref:Reverse transcriptase domain-containing protein n=1 Tax=Mucor velutinosus TaxID=708070 RepID=A0AAN7DCD6_9FUNG|nr:hypothetical protein ATC70_005936 [Mucor velutinosus]
MSAQSTTTSPSSESKPAGNTELRPSDASATKAVDVTDPSQFFLAETSQKLGGQAGEAPTTTASDAMDLDPPSSASSSSIDLAEVQLLSTTLLLEQSEEARAQALARLIQLNTSIQSIIQIRDCLLASKATANDNLVSSAAASFGSSSVDGVKSNKSASVTVFFPNNLPAFQWVGMDEFDPKSPIFPTVDACLLKSEDVMFAYKMDFDKEYARLVPPMLSPEQRTWYGSFTSACTAPASWNDFKSAIKARYGISVLEERQRCASDLLSIQLLPGENVKAFLLLTCVVDPWIKPHPITCWLSCSWMPFLGYDVDIIVIIARESLSTLIANEIAAISAPAFTRTAAGSAASQWAPVASRQTQWVHRKVCFGVNFMGNLAMRLISNLFTDMLDQVLLYIDHLGCLTYTDSLDEHVALVAEVIRRLTKANLQINQDKFVFAQRSVVKSGLMDFTKKK